MGEVVAADPDFVLLQFEVVVGSLLPAVGLGLEPQILQLFFQLEPGAPPRLGLVVCRLLQHIVSHYRLLAGDELQAHLFLLPLNQLQQFGVLLRSVSFSWDEEEAVLADVRPTDSPQKGVFFNLLQALGPQPNLGVGVEQPLDEIFALTADLVGLGTHLRPVDYAPEDVFEHGLDG